MRSAVYQEEVMCSQDITLEELKVKVLDNGKRTWLEYKDFSLVKLKKEQGQIFIYIIFLNILYKELIYVGKTRNNIIIIFG